MATAPSRTLSRAALVSMQMNGENVTIDDSHSRAVDVFISRLRRRLRQLDVLGFDIVAVRSIGYRLIVTAEDSKGRPRRPTLLVPPPPRLAAPTFRRHAGRRLPAARVRRSA